MEEDKPSEKERARKFFIGLARAFAGAIIFALPLFMTMEMWWLGFYLDGFRMALIMLLMIPLLIGLSHYSGFKPTVHWIDDVADAFVAYGVGLMASAAVLGLLNIIDFQMPLHEFVGKVALQSVPASFGAVLASSQMHGAEEKEKQDRRESGGYWTELLLMTAGAMFLAFNLAPTEEMILLAFMMTKWHIIVLALVSLALMHAFVYAVDFRGQHEIPEGTPGWSMFLRFTVAGYAVSLAIGAYVLWTFGRFDDQALTMIIMMTIVLGFPASIGASAARLLI